MDSDNHSPQWETLVMDPSFREQTSHAETRKLLLKACNEREIVASALSNEDIPCITHFVQGVDCSLCEESAPHSHGPLDAEHFTGNRIRTSFVNPPLPIRHFDWVAWIDGDEETGLAGNGKTEQEAIDELIALQMVYDESNANTEATQ
jgi:hypothetical protein